MGAEEAAGGQVGPVPWGVPRLGWGSRHRGSPVSTLSLVSAQGCRAKAVPVAWGRGGGAVSIFPYKEQQEDVWGPRSDVPKPFSPQVALQPAVPGSDQRGEGEVTGQRRAEG